MLTLEILPAPMTVCKVESLEGFAMAGLCFIENTDGDLSLVCETDRTPGRTLAREDGWRAMRVAGTLDFALTGILSGITGALADEKIGIFAVSTYDTDYILVKEENLGRATEALGEKGYAMVFC